MVSFFTTVAFVAPLFAKCEMGVFVTAMRYLNSRSWSHVTPQLARRIVGQHLQTIDSPCPEGAADCVGSVVLTNEQMPPLCNIWLVFNRPPTRLESLALNFDTSYSMAMSLTTDIERALKPGGRPAGDETEWTYAWRSRNSRKRYELFLKITPSQMTPLTPNSPVHLLVRLEQDATDPAAVDDLPFERGTFLSPSQRRH